MQQILSCENLSIGFTPHSSTSLLRYRRILHPREKYILIKKLNLQVHQNEIVFISGKNGSGKSTLLKTLLGQMKQIEGKFSWTLKNDQISYLPQLVNQRQHFSYTLEEILQTYQVPATYYQHFLKDKLTKRWVDCSGGEQQKTLILTRLRPQTKILILDEPFNHLDSSSVEEVKSLLKSLMHTSGELSLMIVSHLSLDFPAEFPQFKVREVRL